MRLTAGLKTRKQGTWAEHEQRKSRSTLLFL